MPASAFCPARRNAAQRVLLLVGVAAHRAGAVALRQPVPRTRRRLPAPLTRSRLPAPLKEVWSIGLLAEPARRGVADGQRPVRAW
ncbi:MAG: hypothetical protein ACRDQB_09615 [Thermocrispum sp.]